MKAVLGILTLVVGCLAYIVYDIQQTTARIISDTQPSFPVWATRSPDADFVLYDALMLSDGMLPGPKLGDCLEVVGEGWDTKMGRKRVFLELKRVSCPKKE